MPYHDELYKYTFKSIYNINSFINQNRTLNTFSVLENGIIRQQVSDSIANFQQKLLAFLHQTDAYENSIRLTRPLSFKLYSNYYMNDSSYIDQSTFERTGKNLPRLNSNVSLQQEFFNHIWWAKGVTRNYLSEEYLLGHLKTTKDFIRFLETEYSVEK